VSNDTGTVVCVTASQSPSVIPVRSQIRFHYISNVPDR